MDLSLPAAPPGDLGSCPCGGRYETKLVDVSFSAKDGSRHTLHAVPQGACPECGSRVYRRTTLERIEKAFRKVRG